MGQQMLGRFGLLPPTITVATQILDLGFEQFDQLAAPCAKQAKKVMPR